MPRPSNEGPPPPPEGYVWSDEAARRMSISRRTLWNRRYTGKGPQGQRWGGRLIYSTAEIEAFNKAVLEGSAAAEAERANDSRPPEPRLAPRKKTSRKPAGAKESERAAA